MDLKDYISTLRRRWLTVALVLVACVGLSVSWTLSQAPSYMSSVRLFAASAAQSGTAEAYQGSLYSTQRVKSYAELAKSPDVAQDVLDEFARQGLTLPITRDELVDSVAATPVGDTVILQIDVTTSDPEQSQLLADVLAGVVIDAVRAFETPAGGENPTTKLETLSSPQLGEQVAPQPVRNIAIGVFLGLLLGAALAIARDLLDTSIKTREDVQGLTEAPVMGLIAYDSSVERTPLITSLEPHAPRAEAFRVLRTNMQYVDVDKSSKLFVVTSALPAEGKSSTAVNLALALAQTGKRTILVEGDLRRPRATATLEMDGAIGITNVLLGTVSLDEAIQVEPDTKLEVLPSGPTPPNPAELLQSRALSDLLEELRATYDMIIVDGPPLLPVTDAALLSARSDGALIVTKWGKTTTVQLEQSLIRLAQVDAAVAGVVLNLVPGRRFGTYGYGYGYGYGDAQSRRRGPLGRRSSRTRDERRAAKRRERARRERERESRQAD